MKTKHSQTNGRPEKIEILIVLYEKKQTKHKHLGIKAKTLLT